MRDNVVTHRLTVPNFCREVDNEDELLYGDADIPLFNEHHETQEDEDEVKPRIK